MIYKKWPAFILFAVSFIILSISGYQCAGPETDSFDPAIPVPYKNLRDNFPSMQANQGSYQDLSSSASSSGDQRRSSAGSTFQPSHGQQGQGGSGNTFESCSARTELRDLQDKEGAMGNFDVTNNTAFGEFRLGRTPNYEHGCARVYIDLSKSQYNTYQGGMTLAYFGDCANGQRGICLVRFETGSGSDAKYNRWSWYNSRTRKYSTSNSAKSWARSSTKTITLGGSRLKGFTDRQFHAIFEDDAGAYILKMNTFILQETRDGGHRYVGFGELYLKMFRQYTVAEISNRAETTGDCYNKGAFVSELNSPPPKPNFKCWFTATGPYSCRPEGDLLASQAQGHRVPIYEPPIDITAKHYSCYQKLGELGPIDLEQAFNTNLTNLK